LGLVLLLANAVFPHAAKAQNDDLAGLTARAEKGEPAAMKSLGLPYKKGQGVRQDHGEGRPRFEKGAGAGDPAAMNSLSVLYL
jgi:TPR repeat protein